MAPRLRAHRPTASQLKRLGFGGDVYPARLVASQARIAESPSEASGPASRCRAAQAGLLRKRLGVLRATHAAEALLAPEAAPALLASLFEAVFLKMNLADFDVNPIDVWPQHHIGVVLRSLSDAGQDRSDAGALTRSCTRFDTFETPCATDLPDDAMVSRVLRPLLWLGLVESRDQNHGRNSAPMTAAGRPRSSTACCYSPSASGMRMICGIEAPHKAHRREPTSSRK